MLVRRTLDRYTRYAQTLIVITVSDLDQVLTCGNVKVNKTKFVALSNMKYIYLHIVKLREREGQGVDPGRSLKGHLWMVDGGWGYTFP